MSKISEVIRIIGKYDSEYRNVDKNFESLLKSISDYIQSEPSLKGIIKTSFDNRRYELYFREFNITVTAEESVKLFEYKETLSYAKQIIFYVEKTRSNKEEVYKVFITDDGFIVENVYAAESICDIQNIYKGKSIMEQLLINLVEKRIISV
ncbi:hypothetical protein B2M27_23140 [Kluyvera intermedia]|uniref:Uncharacterized protein n=1 Tax=Kluyvera intermedia TaxID=61648 RepID=A0ABX3U8Y1_KLUIN|nr:hypothetical protein [Kluyvera intermedia]ORJ47980.1 hypothetical protein B2M27_23140 [Kluyvera intermedia]